MIPFEKEASLTASEEYARNILDSNWDYVVRTTPGIVQDIKGKYPELSQILSRKIREDAQIQMGDVFTTGIPDFLAFNDKGDYKFVEVKGPEDGLRHTQLEWIRQFKGVNAEIWFTKSKKEIEQQIKTDQIEAYTFKDKMGENSQDKVADTKNSKLLLELPKTLGSVIGLSEDDNISWRIKNKNELILDSK